MIPNWKKIILVVTVNLLATDAVLQMSYRAVKGRYTWDSIYKHEIFVIDYLRPVSDERYVTAKRGYTSGLIQIDEYGFRKGSNTESKTSKNIVFIGDSVPFGYGIDGKYSIPSQFADIFTKLNEKTQHVINAALPSYSVNQAIYAYVYDVKEKFPVEGIILQSYDPAQSFWILADQWDVTRNYYTGASRNDIGFVKKFTYSPIRYSSIFYVYWRLSRQYFINARTYKDYTEIDLMRYRQSIRKSLDTLVSQAQTAKYIILLPITRPKDVYARISKKEKIPIEIYNNEFESFARSHNNVHYLDTIALFRTHDDADIFIDECCHLTEKGAALEANYISEYIQSLQKAGL